MDPELGQVTESEESHVISNNVHVFALEVLSNPPLKMRFFALEVLHLASQRPLSQ
jgi:hypothetical protein